MNFGETGMKKRVGIAALAAMCFSLCVPQQNLADEVLREAESLGRAESSAVTAIGEEDKETAAEKRRGWVTEPDGKVYYYDRKGEKQTGLLTLDGKVYDLDSRTGERLTGIQKIGKRYYFFHPKTGERKRGWVDYEGKRYYFCRNWYAVKGKRKIGKNRYYFNSRGELYRSCIVRGKYLADERGRLVRGWYTLNGKRYYASPSNYLIKKGGWHKIGGERYYFEPDGSVRQLSGLVKRGKKYYYYDPNTGKPKSGWVNHGKNRYYFSRGTKAAYTGWHKIKGKKYYFSSKGKLYRNTWVAKKYYVDTDGARQYGWLQMAGQKYYLNETTGLRATGWTTVGKYRYYFDKDGVMQKETWVDDCYLKPNGRMAKSTWVGGVYVGRDGKKTGKTRQPGLFRNGKYTYYLNDQYEKVKGWVAHEGKYYYFQPTNARMATDQWVDGYYIGSDGARLMNQMVKLSDGKTYLFLADGSKATGIMEYNGKKYHFKNVTGEQDTGLMTVDGYLYYFDPDLGGAMVVSDTRTISGTVYTFDEQGHMTSQAADPSEDALGERIAQYAQQFIGNPYVYGGNSLVSGTDCSGFVNLVFAHFGIKVPRTTWTLYEGVEGYATPKYVSQAELKPGDLIFYYSDIRHVAIYIGDGKIVHASNSKPYPAGGIKISNYDWTWIKGCVRYW